MDHKKPFPTKSIICFDCEQEITSIKELIVADKMLGTFHSKCFFNPKKKVSKLIHHIGRFPLRIGFIIYLVIINLVMSWLYNTEKSQATNILGFWIFIDIIFVLGRIYIYFAYEKPIKDKYSS